MAGIADEAGSGVYRLDSVDFEITGKETPADFVDVILDSRTVDGAVYLTLGSLSQEGTSSTVRICSRIRMSAVTAQHLHNFLGQAIEGALNPPKPEKPN